MASRAACLAFAAALSTASTVARTAAADDEPVNVLAQPRLPAPLVLPELTHPRNDVALAWTVGRGATDYADRPASSIALVRAWFESSIFSHRRIYAGATWDYASAMPPDKGIDLDDTLPPARTTGLTGGFANVEAHVRGIFPLTEGLAFGFGMGLVLPTSVIGRDGPSRSAMLAAASLEPTDYIHFQPGRYGIRPWGDLRIVRGPFVFQARQGLDFMIDDAGIERPRTAGRILAHAGFALTRALELSVEATQIYFFFTEEPSPPVDAALPPAERVAAERRISVRERYRISDDRRTAFTIGPSLRLSFPTVDLGVGLLTNLFSPLSPALDSFVAARVSLVAHFR
jgi:hypothetical protein